VYEALLKFGYIQLKDYSIDFPLRESMVDMQVSYFVKNNKSVRQGPFRVLNRLNLPGENSKKNQWPSVAEFNAKFP
jgi:hypothetical protein